MRRRKKQRELPEELRIVLECSLNLVPCKRFYRANIYRMAAHLKEGRCEQCLAFYRQADKELRTIQLLSAWRKSRNS